MRVNREILEASPAVRALFEKAGVSVAEWARKNGFSTGLVYQVLEGRRKCLRGQSHRIALALGLKNGESMSVEDLTTQLGMRKFADEEQPASGGETTP